MVRFFVIREPDVPLSFVKVRVVRGLIYFKFVAAVE